MLIILCFVLAWLSPFFLLNKHLRLILLQPTSLEPQRSHVDCLSAPHKWPVKGKKRELFTSCLSSLVRATPKRLTSPHIPGINSEKWPWRSKIPDVAETGAGRLLHLGCKNSWARKTWGRREKHPVQRLSRPSAFCPCLVFIITIPCQPLLKILHLRLQFLKMSRSFVVEHKQVGSVARCLDSVWAPSALSHVTLGQLLQHSVPPFLHLSNINNDSYENLTEP